MSRSTSSLVLLLALFSAKSFSQPKPLKVAVIDTGIAESASIKLCKDGHRSFIDNEPLVDYNGHGTHIAALIEQHAGNSDNYCLISLKFYANNSQDKVNELYAIKASLKEAIRLKVQYINISAGGASPDKEERLLIEEALNRGIKVIVAAGNNGHDLDQDCNYYPACYDSRLTIVGNMGLDNLKSPSSNYGNYINHWEIGTQVVSKLPGYNNYGPMTGTSQATAITTGKMIKFNLKK